jgi:hypothetical protein
MVFRLKESFKSRWVAEEGLREQNVLLRQKVEAGAPQTGGVKGVFDPPEHHLLSIFIPPSMRLSWLNFSVTYRLYHRFDPPDPLTLRTPAGRGAGAGDIDRAPAAQR